MKFSGLEMGGGGLKPYAYYKYVTPNNKIILRESPFPHFFYSSQVICVWFKSGDEFIFNNSNNSKYQNAHVRSPWPDINKD